MTYDFRQEVYKCKPKILFVGFKKLYSNFSCFVSSFSSYFQNWHNRLGHSHAKVVKSVMQCVKYLSSIKMCLIYTMPSFVSTYFKLLKLFMLISGLLHRCHLQMATTTIIFSFLTHLLNHLDLFSQTKTQCLSSMPTIF